MAFSLGGLLQGLTSATTGAQQGKLDRKKYEQEAMRQLLAQQVTEAQLGQYAGQAQAQAAAAAEAQRRRAQIEAYRAAHPDVADYTDEAVENMMRPTTTTEVNWETKETEDGRYVQINPRTGEERPLRSRAPKRKDPTLTDPKPAMREKASYGLLAAQANAVVNRAEDQDIGIGARVAKKAAAYNSVASAIGRRLAGMSDEDIARQAEVQIESSMTPQELEYYQATKNYLSNILPALSGKTITAREWLMQGPAYFSVGGPTSGPAGKNRRKARGQRIRRFFVEAGEEAAAEAIADLQSQGYDLSEYGYGPAPSAIGAPGQVQGDAGTGGWRHKRPQ